MDDELYESVRRAILECRGEQLDERVTNPYAVGMAAAMKATGDRPPLKKSTIVKAHRIAKKIKEEAEELDELSVKTLDSYRTKARQDLIDAGANDDNRLYNKRAKGYRAASKSISKKFAKEEIDSDLEDELKKQRQTKKSVGGKWKSVPYKTADGKWATKDIKEQAEELDEFAPLLATAARAALPAIGRAVGTSAAGKIGQSAATRAVGGAIGSAVGQNVANRMTSNTSSSSSTTYEEKDSREYDYEGEMVLTQIRMINHHLDELQNILKPDTNLPEWVQAKLTLATDYIQTVTDYMKSEMSEETEIVEGIEVSTSNYEFSHGKKPKGSGGWMFSPHKNPDMKTQKDDVFSTHGSYTDAKKKAAAWAKGKGHRTIHALPEEVELDEAIDTMSDARIKYHATKGLPHGRYTPKEIKDEHERRRKSVPNYHAVKASLEEEVNPLDEARGRPKKDKGYTVHPITKELLHHDNPAHMARIKTLQKNGVLPKEKKEPSEHIINRMGQAATNMTGGQHIKYDNGKTHHVSNSLASRTLTHYRGLKPADKEKFQERIAQSHEDHLDALQGK